MKPNIAPKEIIVSASRAGQRLDNFLFAQFRHLPKSIIYRSLRKGSVRVNKKRAKADYRIQANDVVRLPPFRVGQQDADDFVPEKLIHLLESNILFENEQVMVVNKPSGMPVHGGTGVKYGVIELLRHAYPMLDLELVHRLDRDTSGCLLLAKTRESLLALHAVWRGHEIEKMYQTMLAGRCKKDQFNVEAALKKNQLSGGERKVFVDEKGKASLSIFKVLQRFDQMSYVQVALKTGRTHQIRVHAAHVRHPIIGDQKYGDRNTNQQSRAMGYPQLFLHASSLRFNGNEKLQPIDVKSETPIHFTQLMEQLTHE